MSKKAPYPFYLLWPSRQDYEGRKVRVIARRTAAFVLGVMVALIGVGLLFVKPWSIFSCQRVGPEQHDCRLEKRIAWVNPWQVINVTGVQEARVWSERERRYEEDGQWSWVSVYDVLLVSDSGEVSMGSHDETWAIDAQAVADRINEFLDDPTRESLKLYGRGLGLHTLSTLVSWTLLLFIGIALAISIVSSKLLYGAWAIEGLLDAVEWALERGGRDSKALDRIARLRRAVRRIAIHPDDGDGGP